MDDHHRHSRMLALLPLWAGVLLSPGGVGAMTVDPEAGLARCARIAEGSARLRCFDALAARSSGIAKAESAPMEVAGKAPGDGQGASAEVDADRARASGASAAHLERNALGILPYRENYLLPVTYNANVNANLPDEPTLDLPLFGEDAFDKLEMKFQISFEVPLWTQTRLLNRPLDLYFGYTQLAFFQAYNREYSSPFRETNYEPELGLHWQPDLQLGPAGFRWRLTSVRAAANHQSNGRSEPLSRSWNRLTSEATLERGDLSLGLRLWTLLGNNPPDNPDIEDYLGFGELRARYEAGNHRLGLMLRSPRHPTVQLGWSYPLGERLRIYAQYFNGYGESLVDYDHSVNRIGLGFMLEDGG